MNQNVQLQKTSKDTLANDKKKYQRWVNQILPVIIKLWIERSQKKKIQITSGLYLYHWM